MYTFIYLFLCVFLTYEAYIYTYIYINTCIYKYTYINTYNATYCNRAFKSQDVLLHIPRAKTNVALV